jgi:hypothetical protein
MPKVNVDYEHNCTWCGDFVASERWAIGKYSCMVCGEQIASHERMAWCIAPMHKSNYMLITNRNDLKGLNNKGGLVR